MNDRNIAEKLVVCTKRSQVDAKKYILPINKQHAQIPFFCNAASLRSTVQFFEKIKNLKSSHWDQALYEVTSKFTYNVLDMFRQVLFLARKP